MREQVVKTRKGIAFTARVAGEGPPLLYLHGAGGLYAEEPVLEGLADHFQVFAPEWPGYGEQETEGQIEDMLDFALHGWDMIDALGLELPHVVAHSMGGMIAAEMACLNPKALGRLALICPAGLWVDEHPIPDLFSMLPFELAKVLFHDPKVGEKVLTQGLDFSDMGALQNFLVGNARRLGTAGKILFPIPNRRLSKRLYRQTADTLLVWGREDRFIPLLYAEAWRKQLPSSELTVVDAAGHMVPYEQSAAVLEAIRKFLGAA
ncbi:MAG: alpha/beta fold hydrolase [Myxococcota bacterium]|nr:alpha/beta fold hydrolase [Myxococcota bacterium]